MKLASSSATIAHIYVPKCCIVSNITGLTSIKHRSDTFASDQSNWWWSEGLINAWRPRQNGRHFPDDIFKCIFLNENIWILIDMSLKFFPKGPINNIPALVQIMAWRRPGDKPLSEPMMVSLLTHICVTRPQWVNNDSFPGRWFDSGTWDRKIEQELEPLLELPVPEPPEEKEEEPPAKKEPPTKKGKGAKEEKPEKGGKKKPPEKEEKPSKKEKKPKEDKPESGDFFCLQ